MGKHFGNLQKLKGVIFYSISPNEIKPFTGMINPGFMNTIRRFRENIFFIGVPFLMGFTIYGWANKVHRESTRKNPDDFKDDV